MDPLRGKLERFCPPADWGSREEVIFSIERELCFPKLVFIYLFLQSRLEESENQGFFQPLSPIGT